MGHRVTLIRGDGIGPEVTEATRLAIDATGVAIDWQVVDAGVMAMDRYGTPLPTEVLDSIRETKTALKGPIAISAGPEFRSVDAEICQQFNLYATLRSAKSMVGVKSNFRDIDLVIVQENTEDFYDGIEFERTTVESAEARDFLSRLSSQTIRDDAAIAVKHISVLGSRHIVDFAFRHATVTGRRKVTMVHQAHKLPHTDGLFLDVAREVAKTYPDIEFDNCTLDRVCLQLMQTPDRFDVMVMPNFYGDMLTNLCAGMIGGLGIMPGVKMGRNCAIFEAIYDSMPEDAGQNRANPTALILSGVLMLQHMHEIEAATRLQKAVETVLAAQKSVTFDLATADITPVGTREMAEAIAQAMD